MSEELKPCPFCGAKAEVWQDFWQDYKRTWGLIEHEPDCWLAYDIPCHKQKIPRAEFAAWNRRADAHERYRKAYVAGGAHSLPARRAADAERGGGRVSDAKLYTCDKTHVLGMDKPTVTLDLSEYQEVRLSVGESFVATTPERLLDCVAWLLTNVDTDTLITKDGVEVDE